MAQEKAHLMLSVEAVKKVLSPEEIKGQIDVWYEAEAKNVDRNAEMMSDRIPLHVRKQECQEKLDKEYKSLQAQYGL